MHKPPPSDNPVPALGLRGNLSCIVRALGEAVGVRTAVTLREHLEPQIALWRERERPPGAKLDFMVSNRNLGEVDPKWGESPDALYLVAAVQLVPGVHRADYQFGFLYNHTQNTITPTRVLS